MFMRSGSCCTSMLMIFSGMVIEHIEGVVDCDSLCDQVKNESCGHTPVGHTPSKR
jgi:hypothetical protein